MADTPLQFEFSSRRDRNELLGTAHGRNAMQSYKLLLASFLAFALALVFATLA